MARVQKTREAPPEIETLGRLRPQSLILTIFGDYIAPTFDNLAVSSLVALVREFGFADQAVRSAVSRMHVKGLLNVRRVKEGSYYFLTNNSLSILERGRPRIFEFGTRHQPWKGEWTIVSFSIPESRANRKARHQLRTQLSWLGLGMLHSGVWVNPHDLSREIAALAADLDIGAFAEVFVGMHKGLSDPREVVRECWDLDAINTRYRDFNEFFAPKLEFFRNARLVDKRDAFVQRTMLIHEWRRFPFIDPELPAALLPNDWLGQEAARLFHSLHRLLTTPAESYFRSVAKMLPDRGSGKRQTR